MRGNEEVEHKYPAGNAAAYAVLFSNCRPVYDEPHLKFFTFQLLCAACASCIFNAERATRPNSGQSQLKVSIPFICGTSIPFVVLSNNLKL